MKTYFDGSFYTVEAMRSKGVGTRFLDKFQVAQSSEFQAEILHDGGCLIDY